MYSYVFISRWCKGDISVDSFLDVTGFVNGSLEENEATIAALRRMGETLPDELSSWEARKNELNSFLAGMGLRARFNHCDLHRVDTDTPITADDLQAVLECKQQDGSLKDFLTDSRI